MKETFSTSPELAAALAIRRQALTWLVTALGLFLVLALLGLGMRLTQAGVLEGRPDHFYSVMTLHGLGMAGAAFMSALAGVWFLLSRDIDPHARLMWAGYALIVVGTVGLVAGTLLGRFGVGWYLLYPLPFVNPTWPSWATGLSVAALLVLGTGWLLTQLILLAALAQRFGAGNLLALQYFRRRGPQVEIPPLVLITVVSLIAGVITTVAGAVLLLLYLAQWFAPSLEFDPLALKNIVFLFGHTIVNITMYLGIAIVYDLLPRYSGRPWRTNRAVALAWNAVLVFVLGAFFHHLYMDFAQPLSLQYLGQIFSYATAVPATVVTVFGVIAQVYRSGMRWSFVPLACFLGVVGWVIGGFAAIVDSTIAVNTVFHNTLWVPAHFHTYFLMGYILIFLGLTYRLVGKDAERPAKVGLATMVAGGYGFLTMFYVGGAFGVPRRYATYSAVSPEHVASTGESLAALAVVFVLVFLAGFLLYLGTLALGRARVPA